MRVITPDVVRSGEEADGLGLFGRAVSQSPYAVNITTHLARAQNEWEAGAFVRVFYHLWVMWCHTEDAVLEAVYTRLCRAFPVEGRRYTSFGSSVHLPAIDVECIPTFDIAYWLDLMQPMDRIDSECDSGLDLPLESEVVSVREAIEWAAESGTVSVSAGSSGSGSGGGNGSGSGSGGGGGIGIDLRSVSPQAANRLFDELCVDVLVDSNSLPPTANAERREVYFPKSVRDRLFNGLTAIRFNLSDERELHAGVHRLMSRGGVKFANPDQCRVSSNLLKDFIKSVVRTAIQYKTRSTTVETKPTLTAADITGMPFTTDSKTVSAADSKNHSADSKMTDASDEDESGNDQSDDVCTGCGDGGMLYCCDSCDAVWHAECVADPTLTPDASSELWYGPCCVGTPITAGDDSSESDGGDESSDTEMSTAKPIVTDSKSGPITPAPTMATGSGGGSGGSQLYAAAQPKPQPPLVSADIKQSLTLPATAKQAERESERDTESCCNEYQLVSTFPSLPSLRRPITPKTGDSILITADDVCAALELGEEAFIGTYGLSRRRPTTFCTYRYRHALTRFSVTHPHAT